MPRYRIKAYTRREWHRGYVGYHPVHYQDLQVKRWWGWQTIDREEVPSFVRIYQGAYGDTGGWRSKFAGLGSWTRDGLFGIDDDQWHPVRRRGKLVERRVLSSWFCAHDYYREARPLSMIALRAKALGDSE